MPRASASREAVTMCSMTRPWISSRCVPSISSMMWRISSASRAFREHCDSDFDTAGAAAGAIGARGDQAVAIAVDVTKERDVARFHDDATAAVGAVTVLINVAGASAPRNRGHRRREYRSFSQTCETRPQATQKISGLRLALPVGACMTRTARPISTVKLHQ